MWKLSYKAADPPETSPDPEFPKLYDDGGLEANHVLRSQSAKQESHAV
jgi:hypothetical protein